LQGFAEGGHRLAPQGGLLCRANHPGPNLLKGVLGQKRPAGVQLFDFRQGEIDYPPGSAPGKEGLSVGGAGQGVIVHHHQLAIGGDVDIQLPHIRPCFEGFAGGGKGVFRGQTAGAAMGNIQRAMHVFFSGD
jgi:hypothetical protein